MAGQFKSPTNLRTLIAIATALATSFALAQELPDAPDPSAAPVMRASALPASYAHAVASWRTPEDIAAFAGQAFVYDRARAIALGESSRSDRSRPAIHAPEALYADPRGVCLDLARFGVETLNRIDPSLAARYLMLEFEPVVVEGTTLRRHWVGTFTRAGRTWIFADSRRPGHVAGPYESLDAFIVDYSTYRGRPVVAWRERDSLTRQLRNVRVQRAS
jgi:hypothetical protein